MRFCCSSEQYSIGQLTTIHDSNGIQCWTILWRPTLWPFYWISMHRQFFAIYVTHLTWHSICSEQTTPLHGTTEEHSLACGQTGPLFLFGSHLRGILLRTMTSYRLHAFCYTVWEVDPIDQCSQSGMLKYLDDMLISCSSCKQPIVACTSTKVEFWSIASITTELD